MDASSRTGGEGLARLTVTRVGEGAGYGSPPNDYRLLRTGLSRMVMTPLEMVIRGREMPPRAERSIRGGEELIAELKGAIAPHTAPQAPVGLARGENASFGSTTPHAFVSAGEGDAVILSIRLSTRPVDADDRFRPTRPTRSRQEGSMRRVPATPWMRRNWKAVPTAPRCRAGRRDGPASEGPPSDAPPLVGPVASPPSLVRTARFAPIAHLVRGRLAWLRFTG